MNSGQRHIFRVLASILVGSMVFFIALFLLFFAEVILLSPFLPKESAAFFPPEFVVLLVISTLVGPIIAVFVGRKYYLYIEKSN